jgi:hypothetical protein
MGKKGKGKKEPEAPPEAEIEVRAALCLKPFCMSAVV